MGCQDGKSGNINETFIIESLSITGDTPTFSACTALYTNQIISCSGDTSIFLGTGVISFSGAVSANTIYSNNYFSGTTNLLDVFSGLSADIYTTGATYSNGFVYFNRNDILSAYTLDLTPLIASTNTYVTGGTPNNAAKTYTFTNNTGGTFTVNGLIDLTITGGTFSAGTTTFINNTGGTFTVTGFTSTDTFITGFTYNNNLFTIQQNQGQPDLTVLINSVTGLTVNGNLTVTGNTTIGAISATTLSADNLTISGVTFNTLLIEKVGLASGPSFSGDPKKITITFASDFPDTNYGIFLTGPSSRVFTYESQTVSGFIINSNANQAFIGNVYWEAKQIGEV